MGPGSKTALLMTAVPAATFVTSFLVALAVAKLSGGEKTPVAVAVGWGAGLTVSALLTYRVVKG